jgi:hypothetical protein
MALVCGQRSLLLFGSFSPSGFSKFNRSVSFLIICQKDLETDVMDVSCETQYLLPTLTTRFRFRNFEIGGFTMAVVQYNFHQSLINAD